MTFLKIALLSLTLMFGVGDRFIYFPTRYPTGDWTAKNVPGGLPFEDRQFESKDGTALHGWWVPRKDAKAAILFCHGNGGNITNYAPAIARLGKNLGVSVLIFDYRGYGKSEGSPSEQGLYEDAEAAFAELTGPLGVAPDRVIIYGHSLGTAVATELAMRRRAAGLVLEAPFTSMTEMIRRAVPFLKPEDLVSAKYDTIAKIPKLAVPLLVAHGTRDKTIPVQMGREVFEAAPQPKDYYEVDDAGHSDCSVRGEEFYDRLRDLIDRATAKGGREAGVLTLF
jgi:pimeloyl-ACP methyl ester carboxylesterase